MLGLLDLLDRLLPWKLIGMIVEEISGVIVQESLVSHRLAFVSFLALVSQRNHHILDLASCTYRSLKWSGYLFPDCTE